MVRCIVFFFSFSFSSASVSIFLGQNDSFFLSVHEAKKLSHFDLKILVKFKFRHCFNFFRSNFSSASVSIF